MAAETAVEGVTVRQAGPADFDALLPLFQRFYREEGFDDAVDAVAANLRQILLRQDTAAFVAESAGTAVAGAYAELEDLYVDPDWRGRGVASALMQAGFGWAKARGCRDVEIVLTPHAQAKAGLAPWYEARGFANTGRLIYERRL